MTVKQRMDFFHLRGRHQFLFVLPPFVQLQVVATNSALTELRDMKLVKAGAIESQDTPTMFRRGLKAKLLNVDIRKKPQPEIALNMVNSRRGREGLE